MQQPMSDGHRSARLMAAAPASMAMVAVVSPSPAHRRSLMPVRSVIQASLVSTIWARSSLVTRRSGTAIPQPATGDVAIPAGSVPAGISEPCGATPPAGPHAPAPRRGQQAHEAAVEGAVDRRGVADAVDEADDLLGGPRRTPSRGRPRRTRSSVDRAELAGGGSQDHPFGDHEHLAVHRSGFHHATSRRRGTSLGGGDVAGGDTRESAAGQSGQDGAGSDFEKGSGTECGEGLQRFPPAYRAPPGDGSSARANRRRRRGRRRRCWPPPGRWGRRTWCRPGGRAGGPRPAP